MKKIILATAAVLFASGMAFAGSDRFGADYIPAAGSYPNAGHHSMVSGGANAVDPTATKSIGTADSSDIPAAGYGRGIWGR